MKHEPIYESDVSESTDSLAPLRGVPGGNWGDRKFNYWKVVRLLFKKQFLLKIRKVSSIIEICIALVFYIVLFPLDMLCQNNLDELIDIPPNYTQPFSMDIATFFMMSNTSKLVAMPQSPRMEQMMNVLSMTYLSTTSIQVQYLDNRDSVRSATDESEFSGLGIIWYNCEDDDAFSHPNLEIYCQSLLGCPNAELFRWLRSYIYGMGALENGQNNPMVLMAGNLNSSSTRYPRIAGKGMYDEAFVFMVLALIPVVVATMPDFETVLDEKDSKVAAFAFLNGCPESAYWLATIGSSMIVSFVPYILESLCFCFWFRLVTVDFSLLIFCAFFFLLGHMFFQYWLTTFMKKGSSGRSYTIIMLVVLLFLGIVHQYLTLTENQRGGVLQHILSIVPFSCFQLIIGTLYENGINKQRSISWNNLNDEVLPYPMWMGIMWILLDCVIYFILFFVCNACNPRIFGTPIIKWTELFKKSAWKRAFQKRRITSTNGNMDKFIVVDKLQKTYKNGSKEIEVFTGANFYVNEGEVIVVIGPNGAGKSTLVNILSGAIEPDGGTLQFNGMKKSKRFKALQRYLGVVFQENIIFNRLSVLEHLELWGAFKGISDNNLKDSIDYYAENLQLTHMLDNYAGDLSGGQKRKLCIAMALLGNPPIVIMDEPTAGVDVQARQLIWKTIASLEKSTSIITSHALEEAEAVSSRLFIVSDHDIPFCGTSTELRNKYECGYLLRLERDDGTVGPVLDFVQTFIPSARLSEERKDTICLPVDPSVAKMLQSFKSHQEEFGVKNYSFSVEQLEDMLLKLIETGASLA